MAMTLDTLMHTPFQKEISEGKHRTKLTSMQYIANAKNPDNDYITMTFDIDGDSSYKRNLFVRDISIMLSHVRRQLGRQDETIQPMEFFKELIDNAVEFDIWFTYPIVPTKRGLQRTQNIRFLEPIVAPVADGSPDDSAELDEQAG